MFVYLIPNCWCRSAGLWKVSEEMGCLSAGLETSPAIGLSLSIFGGLQRYEQSAISFTYQALVLVVKKKKKPEQFGQVFPNCVT